MRNEPIALLGEPVTRVIRWFGAEAVVRVKTRTDVVVAIPTSMPGHEVLDLARLVLSAQEHQELRTKIDPAQPPEPGLRSAHQHGSPRPRS